MKLTTKIKQVPGEHTRDGITVPVTRNVVTQMPALPRDLQLYALRATIGIIAILAIVAIIWSTWSIGSLLGGGIGFLVAVVFDVGWIVATLLEYLSRYDEAKRKFPTVLGWILLAVTMIAIGWHGIAEGSIAMAVVGAFVSFFAKVLLIGAMKHVNADLTTEDKQWIAHQTSAAQAKAAIAQVRRQTARIEQAAALELLAMERARVDAAEAYGLSYETETVDAEIVTSPSRPVLNGPTIADMAKADAIRFVMNQLPEAGNKELAEVLQGEGVDVTSTYVKTILDKTVQDRGIERDDDTNVIALRK